MSWEEVRPTEASTDTHTWEWWAAIGQKVPGPIRLRHLPLAPIARHGHYWPVTNKSVTCTGWWPRRDSFSPLRLLPRTTDTSTGWQKPASAVCNRKSMKKSRHADKGIRHKTKKCHENLMSLNWVLVIKKHFHYLNLHNWVTCIWTRSIAWQRKNGERCTFSKDLQITNGSMTRNTAY